MMRQLKRKKTTNASDETKATKRKTVVPAVHQDGELIFKSRPILKFHLELKDWQEEGLIQSFKVPTVDEMIKSKYSSIKCVIDEHCFDSISEARFYLKLLQDKREGTVTSFELQPRFILQDKFKRDGKTIRAIEYVSDFKVTLPDGSIILYDIKGTMTDVFKMKQKMLYFRYPEVELICLQYVAKTKDWKQV